MGQQGGADLNHRQLCKAVASYGDTMRVELVCPRELLGPKVRQMPFCACVYEHVYLLPMSSCLFHDCATTTKLCISSLLLVGSEKYLGNAETMQWCSSGNIVPNWLFVLEAY